MALNSAAIAAAFAVSSRPLSPSRTLRKLPELSTQRTERIARRDEAVELSAVMVVAAGVGVAAVEDEDASCRSL